MSLRVGLGASEDDLEVQGEIDFDFFEVTDASSSDVESTNHNDNFTTQVVHNKSDYANMPDVTNEPFCVENPSAFQNGNSNTNVKTPVITVSYDNNTGAIQKTMIETVIPSPHNYTESKCGSISPSEFHQERISLLHSPRLRKALSMDEKEFLDECSGGSLSSSVSTSDSDISSSLSEESFNKSEGSDSMTDVSPLPSPLMCKTPTGKDEYQLEHVLDLATNREQHANNYCMFNEKLCVTPSDVRDSPKNKCHKKDRVKFSDDIERRRSSEKESIDLNQLLKAIERLEVEQNREKLCSTPFLTNNSKSRKNLTFSNEDVRRIDHDNKLLLKKILAQQNRSKSGATSTSANPPSSAVNRQRQQRQIELDNLAFLKRLESAKPSRDLSRLHLLNDYERRSSVSSSRASTRPPSSVRSLSQLSSFRSSAHSSSGRSSSLSAHSMSKSMKAQPTLLCNKHKKSQLLSAGKKPEWQM